MADHHEDYPLWYYDHRRSIYWYYHQESNAYYMYHQGYDVPVITASGSSSAAAAQDYALWYYDHERARYWCYDQQTNAYHIWGQDHAAEANVPQSSLGSDDSKQDQAVEDEEIRPAGNTNMGGRATSNACPANEDVPEGSSNVAENVDQLAPGWVEETLIELYLSGYSNLPSNPAETAASDATGADIVDQSGDSRDDVVNPQNASFVCSSSKSDDPQLGKAESLFTDETIEYLLSETNECCTTRVSNCTFREQEQEQEQEARSKKSGTGAAHNSFDAVIHSTIDAEDAEADCHFWKSLHEELEEDEQMTMELWQAQYGQVVRSDAKEKTAVIAVNLWNWSKVVQKIKGRKQESVCLVGQTASSSERFHPSLQNHNRFIRTSAVCEADLDLVKVASGKVYRLRQPSSKYLASVSVYDASNPTKHWGFPLLYISDSEDLDDRVNNLEALEASSKPIMAKPFVPNLRHKRFQYLSMKKKQRAHSAAALNILTAGEAAALEMRKQCYRDRAKDRRNLHGRFEIGLGQKMVSDDDPEQETNASYELASSMEMAFGENTVAKRIMEGMGWTEGQSLGKNNDGIIEPLHAAGNTGQTGLGWRNS